MEKLDLSTHAKEIKSNYDSVVRGESSYAIYTTLKDSSLKPTTLGDGDIKDFVSEFEEGAVQFGILRVNPFGSDVQKLVLLGWCPDSAPIKSKVSFATNLSNVGKVLHYHVEITARDSDDLDVDDIMKTVSNASGARYSIQSLTPSSSTGSKFKPAPKPASNLSAPELSTPKPSPSIIKPKPSLPPKKAEEDGWGDEEEIKERDFSKQPLETLPSAYKPTKVDIDALRSGKPSLPVDDKVHAKEEDKPTKPVSPLPQSATISINPSGGLTSLPKPKPSNSVLSRFNQEVVKPEFGTKVPTFGSNPAKDSSRLVGGASRNFASSNGKTPAQLWAEKKGQYVEVERDDKPVNAAEVEGDVEKEDHSVNDVKAKFEQIHLQAEKEEEEEEVNSKKSPTSSFPPPPARETSSFPPPPARETSSFPPPPARETSSFPPPPARETSSFPPPPARNDAFSKFQEKQPAEEDNDGWDEEEEEKEETNKPEPVKEESGNVNPVPLPPRDVSEPSAISAASASESAPGAQPEASKASESKSNVAVAEYDYEKDEDNEIGFAEGETITAIEFVDEDWWQGTNAAGETGLFPASYVSLKIETTVETSASPALPTRNDPTPPEPVKSEGPSAIAEFDYDASEDNELTFKEGDIITDIDQVDDDWWLGSLNGERKLFPSNYVKLQ
ncbi:Actin-binding protein [Pichia kudriavzevii]|uniref:Actin-binding protein n=1 Tax=Pichia kudriavzevii TaxID=4909 RepID=A0A1V2LP22_PICKU|nr:Actin-binding protein [Pichia kudriavzevii]